MMVLIESIEKTLGKHRNPCFYRPQKSKFNRVFTVNYGNPRFIDKSHVLSGFSSSRDEIVLGGTPLYIS